MNFFNVYYNISSTNEDQKIYQQPVNFKGSSSVTFILTGINEDLNSALFLEIEWGDGSSREHYQKDLVFDYKEESIFDELLYGKVGGSIATFYTHNFFNNLTSYNIALSSQLLLTFSNGVVIHVIQPISVFKNSYYDEIGDLNILNTQVTPVTSNYTFVNFESKNNKQTFVGIMSSN
jgi:hypothetical protein